MQNNSMANASFILGIISIILSILLGGGLLFGLLGIMFALLSRGIYKMNKKACTGLVLSIIGSALSVIITIILLITALSSMDSIEKYIDELEEYMYEDSYDLYDDLYNDSYDGNNGLEHFFDYNFDYPDHFDFDHDTDIHKGGFDL